MGRLHWGTNRTWKQCWDVCKAGWDIADGSGRGTVTISGQISLFILVSSGGCWEQVEFFSWSLKGIGDWNKLCFVTLNCPFICMGYGNNSCLEDLVLCVLQTLPWRWVCYLLLWARKPKLGKWPQVPWLVHGGARSQTAKPTFLCFSKQHLARRPESHMVVLIL